MSAKRKGQNPPQLAIDAKWTSVDALAGWRHFRIATRRYQEGRLEVELMAICDRSVRIWTWADHLGDRERFLPGWLAL